MRIQEKENIIEWLNEMLDYIPAGSDVCLESLKMEIIEYMVSIDVSLQNPFKMVIPSLNSSIVITPEELEIFKMCMEEVEQSKDQFCNATATVGSFGCALEELQAGLKVARTGWNGKKMHLSLQVPDINSKMTLPYIYMKTADDNQVPWLASQTDMLSNDWIVVG